MTDFTPKIKTLKEWYKNDADPMTFREYVEWYAENDSTFFRWLFDKAFAEDFARSLNNQQRDEYQQLLNSL